MIHFILCALFLTLLSSCTKTPQAPSDPQTASPTPTLQNADLNADLNAKLSSELITEGRLTYVTYCTACHNMDPQRDGSTGPAVAGSTLALLEARVISAKYPENYKPKRETTIMQAMPNLKEKLPALHAFLNSN